MERKSEQKDFAESEKLNEPTKIELNIPASWSDIKLEKYQKFFNFEYGEQDERLSHVKFLALVCDIDEDELMGMPIDAFNEICRLTEFVYNADVTPKSTMEIDGRQWIIQSEDLLTTGQWVDAENISLDGRDSLASLLAIVCHCVGEKYDVKKFDSRVAFFNSRTMDKILPLLAFFFACQKNIVKRFQDVFRFKGGAEPICETYRKFCKRWSWYKIIVDLAKGDILDVPKVVEMPIAEVLTFLRYEIDRKQAEKAQMKFLKVINNLF